ncbi:MAG: Cof-type HAD-IIB family hydrolase [Treponema sp.]|nr:Cof-type HAD-IIB family hydrolase [Treponema sp.]
MSVSIKLAGISAELKALVFDLDGTILAPGAVLTERTLKAILSCEKKGLEIILATGRAVEASEKFRVPLGAVGPMVYFNGAIIADMPENKILHTTLLAKEIAEFCVDLSQERGIYFQMYVPGTALKPGQPLLTDRDDIQRDKYHNHTGILAELCDLKELLRKPELPGIIKGMFLADSEILDKLRPIIETRYGKDVYVVRSTSTYLEVLNPGVSKGLGLGLALDYRGIRPEEAMVFGDEENDLPMFDHAGFGVCPANAKDNVKVRADYITPSNAEDGIAVFLEEVFLR